MGQDKKEMKNWLTVDDIPILVKERDEIRVISNSRKKEIESLKEDKRLLMEALEGIINLKYEMGKSRPYIEQILTTAKTAINKVNQK
jgi:hypothetical protein